MHRSVKVVILYDWHDHIGDNTDHILAQQHAKEVKYLLKGLKKCEHEINYYCEYNNSLKEAWQNFTEGDSSTSVPLIDCARGKDENTSLFYKGSEKRTPQDFMLRYLFIQTEQFIEAFKDNHQFPSYFYTLTIQYYLNTIDQRSIKVEIVQKSIATKVDGVQEQRTALLKNYLTALCKNNDVSTNDHFLTFISKLSIDEKNALFLLNAQEMAREFKMTLLHDVLASCNDNPLIVNIVHVGADHAAWLEKNLAFAGMTNDNTRSITHAHGFFHDQLGVTVEPTLYPMTIAKAISDALAERNLSVD